VERALKSGLQDAIIRICWRREADHLAIEVYEPTNHLQPFLLDNGGDVLERNYNRVLMELLVDSVEIFSAEGGGTCIRLVKRLEHP